MRAVHPKECIEAVAASINEKIPNPRFLPALSGSATGRSTRIGSVPAYRIVISHVSLIRKPSWKSFHIVSFLDVL